MTKKYRPASKNHSEERLREIQAARVREWRREKRKKYLEANPKPKSQRQRDRDLKDLYALPASLQIQTIKAKRLAVPAVPLDNEEQNHTTYLKLYNKARTDPITEGKTKARPHAAGRPRKSRHLKPGDPFTATATLLPHILKNTKQIDLIVNAWRSRTCAERIEKIPRGTLTQAKLRTLLHYYPDEGFFIWVNRPNRGMAGTDIHRPKLRPRHIGRGASRAFPKLKYTDGLTPQHKNSPTPPTSYPGGRILTGRYLTGRHPIDNYGRPICKPIKIMDVHTIINGARVKGTQHVRPYNPMRVITVGGVTYPAWQLAILWMGAGCKWLYAYGAVAPTPVPASPLGDAEAPDTNVDLTFTTLDNKPAPPVFRDGDTLNLTWENIRPDTAPIYPSQDDLLKAQRKFDALYKRKLQKERQFQALTAQEKRNHLSNQARKERIRKEQSQHRAIHKYDLDKCIVEIPFNKVQNKWIVQIPHKPKSTFFSYDDALAHYTETMARINGSQPKPNKTK